MTRPRKRMAYALRIGLFMIGLSLVGASRADPAPPSAGLVAPSSLSPAPPSPAPLSVDALTLQELMEGRVDPAADALWDSVAFIASTSGEEDRRPRTAAQWKALRMSALQLLQAAGRLEKPGLRVGDTQRPPGIGELAPAEIQRRLDASQPLFANKARNLERTARKALASIDGRNADALMAAGGLIDAACEACHMIYWYPAEASSRR